MAKMVMVTIDGQKVSVPEGTLVVDAAKKLGIDIPVFCYHPKMEPVGMCRMCLVEIGRPVIDRASGQPVLGADGSPTLQVSPKLETACTTPVTDGMVIVNTSDKVKAGREDILEFLLTSHPLDCPVCDKGGECPLQNLTIGYGPGESRYLYDEKMHLAKQVPLGELIYLDRERCIQCARCVRFQDKVADDPVIGFYHRGRSLEIVTFSEPGFDSYFSGNTTDICPVGALTTSDFRFRARPWELKPAASLCTHCPVGCNTTVNVRREAASGGSMAVKRIMPRQNEAVNEIWLCDKGRFAHHYAHSSERLTQPLVRRNGELVWSSWDEALEIVASSLREAGEGLLTIAGGRLSNEDLFNLSQLTAGVKGKTALYTHMAGGDLAAQVGLGQGSNIGDMGPETAILVVACDLEEEAPLWWLRVKQAAQRGAKLIVANPRATKTDRYAAHILRYPYGSEAAAVLAMLNSLSAKRPDLPAAVQNLLRSPELQAAAKAFAEAQNAVVFFGSEGTGLAQSRPLSQACANLLIATNHVGRTNNGLVGVWPRANEQGAWDIGFRPVDDLASAMKSAKALYVVAADPAGDDPSLAEAASFLVVQDLFLTSTARLADVVLPVQSYLEREGSFTSGERRVQRYYPAIPEKPGSLPDFGIAGELGQRLGLNMESRIPAKVFARLAASVPDYAGLSYTSLAEVHEQWPIVGRGDLYYGGTTYENTQGLGAQLTPAAQKGASIPLGWIQPVELEQAANGLLAVPVTRLYDRGSTVLPSGLLGLRIGEPTISLHPATAAAHQLSDGSKAEVSLGGASQLAKVRLDASLPEGIVLVARSMGLPVKGPAPVEIKAVQPEYA